MRAYHPGKAPVTDQPRCTTDRTDTPVPTRPDRAWLAAEQFGRFIPVSGPVFDRVVEHAPTIEGEQVGDSPDLRAKVREKHEAQKELQPPSYLEGLLVRDLARFEQFHGTVLRTSCFKDVETDLAARAVLFELFARTAEGQVRPLIALISGLRDRGVSWPNLAQLIGSKPSRLVEYIDGQDVLIEGLKNYGCPALVCYSRENLRELELGIAETAELYFHQLSGYHLKYYWDHLVGRLADVKLLAFGFMDPSIEGTRVWVFEYSTADGSRKRKTVLQDMGAADYLLFEARCIGVERRKYKTGEWKVEIAYLSEIGGDITIDVTFDGPRLSHIMERE